MRQLLRSIFVVRTAANGTELGQRSARSLTRLGWPRSSHSAGLTPLVSFGRYDVSSLTALELLRWDYKQGERVDGVAAAGLRRGCRCGLWIWGPSYGEIWGDMDLYSGSVCSVVSTAFVALDAPCMAPSPRPQLPAPESRFGIAAICETLPALLNRSGGSRGLEEAMAAAAARRGGLLAPAWNLL